MMIQIPDEKTTIEKLINSDTEDVDEDSEWIKWIKDETKKMHLREGIWALRQQEAGQETC
jgi:hypothetical protein